MTNDFNSVAKTAMDKVVAQHPHRNEALRLEPTFVIAQVVQPEMRRLSFVLSENLDRLPASGKERFSQTSVTGWGGFMPNLPSGIPEYRYSVWRMFESDAEPVEIHHLSGTDEGEYYVSQLEVRDDGTIIAYGLDDKKWEFPYAK